MDNTDNPELTQVSIDFHRILKIVDCILQRQRRIDILKVAGIPYQGRIASPYRMQHKPLDGQRDR